MSIRHVLEYLERTAQSTPERIAFVDEATAFTFGELMQTAQAIGTAVAGCAQPRQPVIILMNDRSVHCVAAMLGVLYAGCCYVPLDASLPKERLRLIAGSLQPALVLHDECGEAAAAAFACSKLRYAQAASHESCAQQLAAVRAQVMPEDPMAIMYTSGSTGVPKGVVQSMRSHVLYTEATIVKYGFTQDDVFANQSPFFYANSIIDIFPTLSLGARTVILPAKALAFPKVLIGLLNDHRVTELTMTPSSYVKVAASGVLAPGCLPHLEYIVLSGEAAHWATLQRWMAAAPAADVWNFYGSTELYSVAVWPVRGSYDDGQTIPVGPLYDGVELRLLDDDGREALPGEPGEMYLHTPWLADGYYADPERTNEVFFTGNDGKRFYRSGDMGMLNAQRQLVVLGRRDTQIKHMGYRMEIGETERALLNVEGLDEGCCLYDKASGLLHCFYTGSAVPKAVSAALKQMLPRYAIPDQFHPLDSMPYTGTMKIDRAELRKRI